MTGIGRTLIGLIAAAVVGCTVFHVPLSPPLTADATGRLLSRGDARVDLDTLLAILERVHPDLYGAWSRNAVDAERARLVADLPASMTRVEWWLRLAPFVAQFGDGHTAALMPGEELESGALATTPVFSPSVVIGGGNHLVVSAPFGATGIARGDRVVSVNRMDADSLLVSWSAAFSGESMLYRRAMAAEFFRALIAVHGVDAPYVVGVARDGDGSGTRTVTVAGITRDSFAAVLRRRRRLVAVADAPGAGTPAGPRDPNFTYRVLAPGIGYVDFHSMSGDVAPFQANVAAMFRQVVGDSVRVLIVDLRNNGGGDSRLGEAFLAHLTTRPYRTNARKEWKMSAEYRAYLASGLAWPIRTLHLWALSSTGRAMFGTPVGTVVAMPEEPKSHPAAQPFFGGPVCVLIGPRTFSSASDIADAIKTYHLAPLIGGETGGRVNTFGEAYRFRLPRSRLDVGVSSARFVRASGDTSDHRGVVPDIVVTPTTSDLQAARDAVLERAKTCTLPRS